MFVALRDLRFARGRFALMGAVIVLITLLVGLLSGLTSGLSRQNTSAITELPATQIAFGNGGGALSYTDSTVTEQQWRQWAAVPGVTSAQPLGIATTKATASATEGAADHARSTAVSAFGVLPGSGLAPDAERIGGQSAVLSTGAATDLGLSPGESFDLAGIRVSVAAVRGDASFSHTPVVWVSLALWQKLAPPLSGGTGLTASVIALTTTSGTDLAAAERATGTTTLGKDASVSAIGSYTAENGSLQLMRIFLFAISALVIGAFFTVWTIQRGGEIAILKALGASTRTLLADALGQAAILLVLGTALGTGAAAGIGAFASSSVPFVLTPTTFLAPAAVMIALGMLGAALSIRRIAAIDPLTALGSAR